LGSDKLKITRGNQSFDLTLGGATETFKVFYNYYEGWDKGGQHSGAYIFRPLSDTPKEYSPIKKIYYAEGMSNFIKEPQQPSSFWKETEFSLSYIFRELKTTSKLTVL